MAVALLAAAGCQPAQPTTDELTETVASTLFIDAAEPSADRGRELIARYECARCHHLPEAPVLPMMKRCVGCHESIGRGSFREASDAVIAEWQERMHSLPTAPSLQASAPLLSARWVASFLQAPHDLRPALEATMPRLPIGEGEARDIAASLMASDGDLEELVPAPSLATRGGELFEDKQCGSCHAFSGSGLAPRARDGSARGVILAPDLRFTRDRVRPERLAAWMRAPRRTSAMPHFDLTVAEAQALASYLLHTPLEPAAPVEVPARLPLLERPVRYAEVEERVFRKICWHCHAQPDLARGDGGPGMSGGMGFPARHLDLSTYESINSGYLDEHGELTSLFARTEDGTPRLVAVLLARQQEVAGKHGSRRGMPLGFPPLSPEDIQLTESWVAQGRPR